MPTPCLYDTCESLTPWSWSPLLTPSIDTSIKKEGSGSIKISKGAPSGGPTQQFSRDFAQCDLYFGMWLRHNITGSGQGWDVSIRKTNGAYASISMGWNMFLGYPTWGSTVYTPTGGSSGFQHGLFSANEWAWFEIYTDASGNTTFRRGGVGVHSYSGWLIYPSAYLYVNCGDYSPAQTAWLDYAKWGPGWDYPPVPPSLKLHPFWRLKPP